MNKEEIIIYVYATTDEMRECFKLYESLFTKYSKINCYGILKNGIKIQFTNNIRGLRSVKTYDEIKRYLQEMSNAYLQQENKQLKERIDKAIEYINKNWGYWGTHVCEYNSELLEILKGEK